MHRISTSLFLPCIENPLHEAIIPSPFPSIPSGYMPLHAREIPDTANFMLGDQTRFPQLRDLCFKGQTRFPQLRDSCLGYVLRNPQLRIPFPVHLFV
jgi:hypothetical protein